MSRTPIFAAFLAWCVVARSGEELPLLRPILPADTVLVVAPHPDDESLCCGGLIHAARLAGAIVISVISLSLVFGAQNHATGSLLLGYLIMLATMTLLFVGELL